MSVWSSHVCASDKSNFRVNDSSSYVRYLRGSKRKTWQLQAWTGLKPDLCDASAVLYQLNYIICNCEISNDQLSKGANKAADARIDIYARGFWEKQQSTFFKDTYKDLEPSNTYKLCGDEKKHNHAERVN